MSYQPQPGTIAYRAIRFLGQEVGAELPAVVICEELGIETVGFAACMKTAVAAGLVKTRPSPQHARHLLWSLGEGKPAEDEPDEPLHRAPATVTVRPGPLFPGVSSSARDGAFRVLLWEGKLLATGMEIIDGVAVFTPEQIDEVKRVVAWAHPAEVAA